MDTTHFYFFAQRIIRNIAHRPGPQFLIRRGTKRASYGWGCFSLYCLCIQCVTWIQRQR